MARYVEGLGGLLTSNLGEHGEIVVPELDTPENHPRLAEIRARAGRGPATASGTRAGWATRTRDDGHAGQRRPGLLSGRSDEAIGRTHASSGQPRRASWRLRRLRAPDHIRRQVAKAAFGGPATTAYPEQIALVAPWSPAKLYNWSRFSGRDASRSGWRAGHWLRWLRTMTPARRSASSAAFAGGCAASGPLTTPHRCRPYPLPSAPARHTSADPLTGCSRLRRWRTGELPPDEQFSLCVPASREVRCSRTISLPALTA
jgi:hypothetical protein